MTVQYAEGRVTMNRNAFGVQVGYVLFQKECDETTNPVAHWSRMFTDAKREYDETQQDCHAIHWTALLPCPYLENPRTTNRADHD